jgi:HNH endonuclease
MRRIARADLREGNQIDHFWPRSRYPEKTYAWPNLLWSCGACNSKKSARFPLDAGGAPLLLNPTDPLDHPREHLQLAPNRGIYEPLSPRGIESVSAYDLNRDYLQRERIRVFTNLKGHVENYDVAAARGEIERATEIKAQILSEPHASMLIALVELADSPAADLLLRATCREAIARRPEIRSWCEGL